MKDSISDINSMAFYRCLSLKSIRIPDSVKTIESFAFDLCVSLKNVVLSKSLKEMGWMAFGRTAIETIEIPKTLTDCEAWTDGTHYSGSIVYEFNKNTYWLDKGPFGLCENLKNVTFEKGTTKIVDCLFAGCVGLEKIVIPDTVTTIEKSAFAYCFRLKDVVLEKSLTIIDSVAFCECMSLSEVTIPASVTTIASDAFSYPQKITVYGVKGSYAEIYANDKGMKFVDISVPATKISLAGNAKDLTVKTTDSIRAEFALTPSNSTDVVTLKCANSKVTIQGMDIKCATVGDYEITATTTSGLTYTFTLHVIDDHVHNYGEWKRLNDTQHYRVCADNSSHTEKANHTWDEGKVTTVATCNNTGVKTYTCTVCKATKTATIAKTSHSWDTGKVTKEATCKTAGTKTYTCTVCKTTKSETIPKLTTHNWDAGKVTKEATCTEKGVKTFTCTVCKNTKTEEIEATGHIVIVDAAVAATCTTDGKTEGSHCSVCNAVFMEQTEIKATGHSFGSWMKLNDAQHQRICANDNSHVEREDHQWNDGEVTKEATINNEGEKTFTCTVCHATKAEPIKEPSQEDIKDETTDITISFSSGTFDAGVTLKVQEVKDNKPLLDETYTSVTAFNIFTFASDKKVQPKSTVTVKIPIPENYKVDAIEVYHIADNGAKEKVSIRIENDYIIFTADSFSIYVIVDTSTKVTVSLGDVDGNGKVESADARLALRASVKLEPEIVVGTAAYTAADVNKDGIVGSDDARTILRVSVKLETFQ